MDRKVIIYRFRDTGVETLGDLFVMEDGQSIFDCVCLEPSWIQNHSWISCIPVGTYRVKQRMSADYGQHFHIQDVKDRSYVLIHAYNYFNQSEACIAPGDRFQYLNGDEHYDVVDSRDTLNRLLELLPENFELTIRDHDHKQIFFNTI